MERHSGPWGAPWEAPWEQKELRSLRPLRFQGSQCQEQGRRAGESSRAFLDCTGFHLGPGDLCAQGSGSPRRPSLAPFITSSERIHRGLHSGPSGCPGHLGNGPWEEDIQVGWSLLGCTSLAQNATQCNCASSIFHLPFSPESGPLANLPQRLLENLQVVGSLKSSWRKFLGILKKGPCNPVV